MVKQIAALTLVTLAACAQPAADAAPLWSADEPLIAARGVTFVPADDELAALLSAADLAWEAAGVRADFITIAAPGTLDGTAVEWRTTAEVSAACGMATGRTAIGCMLSDTLLVSSDADGTKLALIVRHEMGHAMRDLAEQWHLDCDDRTSATMCDGSTATQITAADTEFICASQSAPCD